MSSVITVPGIGSGLDVQQIVGAIVDAERTPRQTALDTREASLQAKISALGSFKGALSSVQSAITALQSESLFGAKSATSSDSAVLSASALSSAQAGSYEVEVQSLASAQKVASQGFTDADTVIGRGTLTISVGSGSSFDVVLDEDTQTLGDIREAINNAAGNTGVKANLISTDAGLQLVLSSASTGAANTISVSAVEDASTPSGAPGLGVLTYGAGASGSSTMTEIVAASDAQVTIDGLTVSNATNSFSGAISGVSFTVLEETEVGQTLTLEVTEDSSGVGAAVSKFVEAFNGLVSLASELTKYNSSTQEAGVLLGDSTISQVMGRLRSDLASSIPGLAGNADSFVDFGIKTNADGSLSFDSSKLTQALTDNPDSVKSFFTGESGWSTRVDRYLEGYLASGGILAMRTDSLGRSVERVSEDRVRLDERIAALEERYYKKFQGLDAVVSGYNSTLSFLSQQFAQSAGTE